MWKLLFIFSASCLGDDTGVRNPASAGGSGGITAPCSGGGALLEVEQRVLPQTLVTGAHSQTSLLEYYSATNQELLARYEEAKSAYASPAKQPYRAVTLVAGAAGIGKTFLKGQVYSKSFREDAICKFDIVEVYDKWVADGLVIDKPDLACEDIEVNHRPSVREKNRPLLRDYLQQQNASFYVIDSLDEIHPDDCAWVLEQVEDFVFHQDRQFTHVAVFGRGPAFSEFWRRRTEHRSETDVQLFLLNPPVFRTTGDLLVSSWNYHTWRFGLKWSPDGGPPQAMSLADYAAWVASGFSRDGRFQSVTSEPNDDMRSDVQHRLLTCGRNYPVICATLYNLAGNSAIREILQRDVMARQPYDERRIMRSYFNAWLVRETKAHGLPSSENPSHLDLYLGVLEQIAVKYLRQGGVDDDGFFAPGEDDRITVTYAGRDRSFSVKRVLDSSGVVFIDPRQSEAARYRFEPVWLHRMLVEMHNERVAGLQPRFVAGLVAE